MSDNNYLSLDSYKEIDKDYIPKEGSKYDLLLKKTDNELIQIIQNELFAQPEKKSELGKAAQNYFIARNKKFITQKVNNMAGKYPKCSFNTDDLYQAGRIGIMTALEGFDINQNKTFANYAYSFVENEIRQEINAQLEGIRIPENIKADIRKIAKYKKDHPEYPDSEIKTYIIKDGIMTAATFDAAEQYKIMSRPESGSTRLSEDDDTTIFDTVKDENASPSDYSMRQEVVDTIANMLRTLPEDQKKVIELMFGFADGQPRTVAYIADKMNIPASKVRTIRTDVMKRLQNSSLKDFVE